MKTRTFKVQPHELSSKIEELSNDGWEIVSTVDTSTPSTPIDGHGVSYGGSEITIIAKK